MPDIQMSRYCKYCERKTLHKKHKFSALWGIVLTACTMGLFLLIWIPAAIFNTFKPYRCQVCGGSKRL